MRMSYDCHHTLTRSVKSKALPFWRVRSLARVIEGEMSVPYYSTDNARPGSTLIIDENNNPVFQGYIDVPFTVFIPYSCTDGSRANCPIVNYGHGLLGSRQEVRERERRK